MLRRTPELLALLCLAGCGAGEETGDASTAPADAGVTLECEGELDCDDGLECTVDECVAGNRCEHRPLDALCAEGERCVRDVGCVDDAPPECTDDADCGGGDACEVWRCDGEFGCVMDGVVDCDDGDACTADACDPAGGCVHGPIDADGDGQVPVACGGSDCDDGDDAIHPGAEVTCGDGVDDDCDMDVDEACATDCGPEGWRATSSVGAPSPRYWHGAVWTGDEMMIWGGNASGTYLDTGGLYDPDTDSWRATPTEGAPSGRLDHVMVWTGAEVLVWGGRTGGSSGMANGARFDPATLTWTPMSTAGAPPPTAEPEGVWTGSELLVWGDDTRAGGRYDPTTDTWTPMSESAAPSPRDGYVMTWIGDEVAVWGGRACGGGSCPYVNTGGRYDPAADAWRATSTSGAPTGTYWASGVWTGAELLVFGGRTCGSVTPGCDVATGGRYDPVTDTWTPLPTVGAPSARHDHTGVWTGDRMLIWGGGAAMTETGAIFDPSTDAWAPMTTAGAPVGRRLHAGVWTGRELIVWGGVTAAASTGTGDGGVYCPP